MATLRNRTADDWQLFANSLLLQYIRNRIGSKPSAWGSYENWRGMHSEQAHSVGLIVAEKNRFADELASLPAMPDPITIRTKWRDRIERAELEIAAYLGRPMPDTSTLPLSAAP